MTPPPIAETVLTVSGPSGLASAVPVLLGFVPRDSLVVLFFSGARHRVALALRADLDSPVGQTVASIGHQARLVADHVAVLVHLDRWGVTARTHRLVDQVVQECAAAAVPVIDVLAVRGERVGRWPPGQDWVAASTPIDRAQAVRAQAATAWSGRAVLADRQAVARSIAGPVGSAATRAEEAFDEAADKVLAVIGSKPAQPDPLLPVALATVRRALRSARGGAAVPVEDAALLAVVSSADEVRDELVRVSLGEPDEPWVPMLIAMVTQVRDRDALGLLGLLAVLAYRVGDGALANVVIDRCLAVAPAHRLSHLMLSAMAAGLRPEHLDELCAPADGGPGQVRESTAAAARRHRS